MKALFPVQVINVGLDFGTGRIPVGRLALRERRIYFEYGSAFLEQGLEISPFLLSVKSGVTTFDNSLFEGLPGVFDDSPPMAGCLLFDRFALAKGMLPAEITPLDRLVSLGSHALGALVYESETDTVLAQGLIDLDSVASPMQEVLEGASTVVLQELLALMSKESGIQMPDVHLFPSKEGPGYFAARRFDRDGDKRFHMYTACGLLHADSGYP